MLETIPGHWFGGLLSHKEWKIERIFWTMICADWSRIGPCVCFSISNNQQNQLKSENRKFWLKFPWPIKINKFKTRNNVFKRKLCIQRETALVYFMSRTIERKSIIIWVLRFFTGHRKRGLKPPKRNFTNFYSREKKLLKIDFNIICSLAVARPFLTHWIIWC